MGSAPPRGMLTRRDFFTHAGRLVVFLPVGASLIAACGGSSNKDCSTADSQADDGTSLIVTSSCDGGHDHDFSVAHTDLATPPAAGVSGNSTPYDDDQHVHTVSITQAQLAMIQAGQTVSITSGTTLNHSHVFNFKKAA